MPETPVKVRVSRLERLMAQLIETVDRVDRQIEESKRDTRELKAEMRDFKTEMRFAYARSDREMREFKDEMREFKTEMQEFKAEMLEFKDEMREFKEETRQRDIEWRKEKGELGRKMGTMAEDMVAPSIPEILRRMVGCPKDGIEFFGVRVKRRHPITKESQEYDVVAICGDYLFINETKSRLDSKDLTDFATEMLPNAREFFPEYRGKKIIGAIASLYVDDSLVRLGERLGLIVLGFGEDVMDVLNQPGFVLKCF